MKQGFYGRSDPRAGFGQYQESVYYESSMDLFEYKERDCPFCLERRTMHVRSEVCEFCKVPLAATMAIANFLRGVHQ